MPFAATKTHSEQYWTNHFENFLKKFLQTKFTSLDIRRSEPIGGSVLDKIIFEVTQSDIVIADITDFNPNVIWELGIRNSFKHGTITIAEKGTELPFDLKDIGTLFYDFSQHPYSIEINEFFVKFEKSINDCLNNPKRTDSPVLEAIPRGMFFEIVKRQENLRKLNAIIIECKDNIDVLETALNFVYSNQAIRNDEKSEDNYSFLTERGRVPALEHLIVNQYLMEDEQFYKTAIACLHSINEINDQFVSWEFNDEFTELWLINKIPSSINRLKIFIDSIKSIQDSMQLQK
jgi:predicted transcriptional regulator